MARINIEDSLLHDPRMAFIIRKIGQRLALGTWYEVARCAQKYWLDDKKPIPEGVWDLLEIDPSFVESGLVEKTKCGYYLKGSDDFFAWIVAQRENGKKGGRPKKQELAETHGKPTAKPIKATDNPLTLALALTPALALDKNTSEASAALPITPDELVHEFNKLFSGKLKPAIGLGSGEHLQNFLKTCLLLKTKSDWISLLESAASQDWLVRQSKMPLTLTWLVREENAIKVLEGKYTESLASEEEKIKQFFGGMA